MKRLFVHSTRREGKEIEVIVTKAANHMYGQQGETAIYAHPVSGGRGKWYIGYGGDFIPANKADMTNISPIRPVRPDDERGY